MKKPEGMTYRHNAIYAIYKGEELLATGTASECAKELNVKPDYICWLITPSGKKRQNSRLKADKVVTADVIDWEE